jgi:glyoxylase I family protein
MKNQQMLSAVHHIAIICSDYPKTKKFYTDILGLRVLAEHYREDRDSYKLDLALGEQYIIEVFSFPNPPKRVSQPEACGLRHLAFAVKDIVAEMDALEAKGVQCQPLRVDPFTAKRFTFFEDPDNLPIEFYEA